MTIARHHASNEVISVRWEPSRDDVFFRIVMGLFSAKFLSGAGILLASYDPSDDTELPNELPWTAGLPAHVTYPRSLSA
jgi:hypothetical protein